MVFVDVVDDERERHQEAVAVVAHVVGDGAHDGVRQVVDEADGPLLDGLEIQHPLPFRLTIAAHDAHVVPVVHGAAVAGAAQVLVEIKEYLFRRSVADMGQVCREGMEESYHVIGLVGVVVAFVDQVFVVPPQRGSFLFEGGIRIHLFLLSQPGVRYQPVGDVPFRHGAHVGLAAFGGKEAVDVDDSREDAADGKVAVAEVGQIGVVQLTARDEDEFGVGRGDEQFDIGEQFQHVAAAFARVHAIGEAFHRVGEFGHLAGLMLFHHGRVDLVHLVEHDEEAGSEMRRASVRVDLVDDIGQFRFNLADVGNGNGFTSPTVEERDGDKVSINCRGLPRLLVHGSHDAFHEGIESLYGLAWG